jgi:ubiquinone/menaquinone biosynthesis C-methylase UbiE
MTTTTTPADLPRKRFARAYPKMAATAEQRGATEHRRRLLDGLHGRVVEIGAGHGLNFPHYPAEVTEVVALEPEPTLRAQADEAAAGAPVPVRVVAGVADALPLEDAGFDAAVSSLVLCSVPDQQAALDELHRVLRPGGELRFYEHVIPNCQPKRVLLQIVDYSGLWPKLAGGCHPARDTTTAITRAGFDIEAIDRFGFSPKRFDPVIPFILGRARAV